MSKETSTEPKRYVDMTPEERIASDRDNARPLRRGIIVVLILLLIAVFLLYGGGQLVHQKFCWLFKNKEANTSDVEEVVEYLRRQASSHPDVRQLLDTWDKSKAALVKFPTVMVTECSEGLDAHHFKFFPDHVFISKNIWECVDRDAMGLKAKSFLGEFQHTRFGGFQEDVQITQNRLDSAVDFFEPQHQSDRVKRMAHDKTRSKWDTD